MSTVRWKTSAMERANKCKGRGATRAKPTRGRNELRILSARFWQNFPLNGDPSKRRSPVKAGRCRKRPILVMAWAVNAQHASGKFAGLGPFAPRNFSQDLFSRLINLRGFESHPRTRNVLRHRFLSQRCSRFADENRKSNRNTHVFTALKDRRPRDGSRD